MTASRDIHMTIYGVMRHGLSHSYSPDTVKAINAIIFSENLVFLGQSRFKTFSYVSFVTFAVVQEQPSFISEA